MCWFKYLMKIIINLTALARVKILCKLIMFDVWGGAHWAAKNRVRRDFKFFECRDRRCKRDYITHFVSACSNGIVFGISYHSKLSYLWGLNAFMWRSQKRVIFRLIIFPFPWNHMKYHMRFPEEYVKCIIPTATKYLFRIVVKCEMKISVNFAKLNFNYFTEWTIQSHSICSRCWHSLIV